MKWFFLISVFCTINFSSLCYGQGVMPVQSTLRYSESEHFAFIYEETLASELPPLIRNCENAYELLTPVFKWKPKEKTVVMFSDAQDIHNGWATVYPRPAMLVYASDSPPGSTIYEPGDYLRRTVFHEYAHILMMDAQYGADAAISSIFGRGLGNAPDLVSFTLMLMGMPPGMLAPRWFQEGVSIWAEEEFVGFGRGQNMRVDMMMRMAQADNRMLNANQWFVEHPEWPFGHAAYLYGMKTVQHVFENYDKKDKGDNTPAALSDSVAHSFLFSFNNRAVPVTGKSFGQLAQETLAAEKQFQQERIRELSTLPFTELPRLTPKRLVVNQPRFGPGGRTIYFGGQEEANRDSLYRYDLASGKVKKISGSRTTSSIYSNLTMSPQREAVYYTRLDIQGRDQVRNEMYRMDTASHKHMKIADEGRYRYPSIRPDWLALVAVTQRSGRHALVEVPMDHLGDPKYEKIWVETPVKQSLIHPVYTPDGQGLVYIKADEQGSQLRHLRFSDGTDTELINWPTIILSPAFHPNSRELVFSAALNGVYNLYRLELGSPKMPQPITHVLGGVFDPDFSPDGRQLTIGAYDSYGYYVTVLDYEKLQPIAKPLPIIAPKWRHSVANRNLIAQTQARPEPAVSKEKPYYSLNHIRLDGWSPWLTYSGDSVMGGLWSAFSDPTGYQELFVAAGMESQYSKPVGSLVYQYSGWYPIITLAGTTFPRSYPDLLRDADGDYHDFDEEVRTGGISLTIPLLRADHQLALIAGYKISEHIGIEESEEEYEDDTIITEDLFEGTQTALWAQLLYFDATQYARSHSYEDGRFISATVEWSDESLGGEINQTRFRADWHEYIGLPWDENHVLKLQGVYGNSWGDTTAQGAFGLGGYGLPFAADIGLNSSVGLRGYSENYMVGEQIAKLGAAYRVPLLRRYSNLGATSPLYIHQIFGEVFYEAGRVWDATNGEEDDDWIHAAGLEVNLSTTLFRYLPISPGIGVAYAFDREDRHRAGDDEDTEDDSKWQFYLSLKTVVNF